MSRALFGPRAMRDSWETPPHLFDPLDAEFGFTLDGAASQENAKCAAYFSKVVNGLHQDWGKHRVWLNPPYGDRSLRAWIAKAFDASQRGALVVCLVPVNASSVWWTHYAPLATEIRWIRGRVRFVGAPAGAPFASCLLIFRPPVPTLIARAPREVAA